jgi:hypothetical protein
MSDGLAVRQKAAEFVKEANAIFTSCRRHCYLPRAKEVLDECRQRLQINITKVQDLKQEAIDAAEEDAANALLGIDCLFRAIFNELTMWIALKDDRPDSAWNALVQAQAWLRSALRAHEIMQDMADYSKVLARIEHVVFPPQMFFSSAYVVGHYECSLCGKEYGTCGHVVGRAYMGEMCSRVPKDIREVDHVAVMADTDPMDKRCRSTSTEHDGHQRDTLTWRIVPSDGDTTTPEPGTRRISGIILCANRELGI